MTSVLVTLTFNIQWFSFNQIIVIILLRHYEWWSVSPDRSMSPRLSSSSRSFGPKSLTSGSFMQNPHSVMLRSLNLLPNLIVFHLMEMRDHLVAFKNPESSWLSTNYVWVRVPCSNRSSAPGFSSFFSCSAFVPLPIMPASLHLRVYQWPPPYSWIFKRCSIYSLMSPSIVSYSSTVFSTFWCINLRCLRCLFPHYLHLFQPLPSE